MSFRYYLMLKLISQINGERTLSGIIHILQGRQSVQAIQDCAFFHIQPLYHTFDMLERGHLLSLSDDCLGKGWISQLNGDHEKYALTPSGIDTLSQLADRHSFPQDLKYTENVRMETDFWLKLQLCVQTLSELIHGSHSFLPVSHRAGITEAVRRFIIGSRARRKDLACALYEELYSLLETMPVTEADILCLQLSGYGMPGLTVDQTGSAVKIDTYQSHVFSKAAIRRLLHTVSNIPSDFPTLARLMSKKRNDLSRSAEETYHLIKEGLTFEKLTEQRQLSHGTIEDHIIELTLKIPGFNISSFLPDSVNQMIIKSATRLHTKQLKPIKKELRDQASYFQIRLALAKEAVEREGN
ncbi:helix-turn-helix domain-containing protein [Sporolactobacillus shoreae]|uniref:helix-turn-helix domain-containing protein n=1 Tax=Sporolactobacillus shoreae TaxID=1465501 RepID=UPI00143327D9|nr:helix-turn-helix domain-containing protein [Sporolactobacillus shoreae]